MGMTLDRCWIHMDPGHHVFAWMPFAEQAIFSVFIVVTHSWQILFIDWSVNYKCKPIKCTFGLRWFIGLYLWKLAVLSSPFCLGVDFKAARRNNFLLLSLVPPVDKSVMGTKDLFLASMYICSGSRWEERGNLFLMLFVFFKYRWSKFCFSAVSPDHRAARVLCQTPQFILIFWNVTWWQAWGSTVQRDSVFSLTD